MKRVSATPDVAEVFENVESKEEVKPVFPEKSIEPLRGLLFLGEITKEVEYGGHVFHIKTLREGEILRIGQLLKTYVGTPVEIEARKMLTVAACIKLVDGLPIMEPYKDGHDFIAEKAEVIKSWYPAVIGKIYKSYIELETSAIEVTNALKK